MTEATNTAADTERAQDLKRIWPQVRQVFAGPATKVIASVNADGSPHVTPIGTLTLRPDCTGYYLERFPSHLPENVERDERICVYAGQSGLLTWLRHLVRGRFDRLVAIRLIGRAGARRPSTEEERNRFLRQVRLFRWTRGHELLWGNLQYARDLVFDGYVPILAGQMTRRLLEEESLVRHASDHQGMLGLQLTET
jgi:hypothetical protein